MLQQFMNVVSEIFPDTLWQPDSAFSHIYAMTYYNPAFFLYTVAATAQAFYPIPSHSIRQHMCR